MKIVSEIKLYEIDGVDQPAGMSAQSITVESHWNERDKVILVVGDNHVTVLARDLDGAIKAASFAHHY